MTALSIASTFRFPLLGSALAMLAACAGTPAHSGTDLTLLPARAADWRIVVGHRERQVELTGDSIVVPPLQADTAHASTLAASASASNGQRETLTLEWKEQWPAMLRVESRQPLDMRPYLGGTLEFDLDVLDLQKRGALRVKVSCGGNCERSVTLIEPARAWLGKGWHHVALAMSCFQREGAEPANVRLPFSLEGDGSGRVSVKNVHITSEIKAGLSCPDYRTESATPALQLEPWAIDWWPKHHLELLEARRQLLASGTPPELVFIGDSITQGWGESGREVWQQHYAPLHALNLGSGGDRTENVLWRLQHGEIDGIAPKVAVLMVGTNNTGQRAENPQTLAAGIKRLVDEIRQRLPGTKVLLLAIFPRGEKSDDYLRVLNERVNKIIAGYADGKQVFFQDINATLMGPDGTVSRDIMPDLLHPNAKGYALWQQAMEPTLRKLMGPS